MVMEAEMGAMEPPELEEARNKISPRTSRGEHDPATPQGGTSGSGTDRINSCCFKLSSL